MHWTDPFVRRPVLASVVSLLILLLGIRSALELEVRQYPELESTTVTVTTAYPGADSTLVKGFITQPLQQAIAEAEGIDYLASTSSQGVSTIEARMELDYDANDALSEIQAKVASQRDVLPEAARDPVITSTTGESTALMYIAFFSETLAVPQITDYLLREVQPRLQALSGVGKAELLGRSFAQRIWIDPQRLASVDLTAAELVAVLLDNNVQAGIGQTRDRFVAIDLTTNTDVSSPEAFERLVVRQSGSSVVRLGDIARTELGSQTYTQTNQYKGQPSTYVAIELAPGANPLEVAERVRAELPDIRSQLPEGLKVELPYDASEFIESSIREVVTTLVEAVLIVLVVVYLTLGSVRAAIVPSVAVPLSLIGGAMVMLAFGFSLNLLTLLAMVLAIGLVVDDAIIIVENVHRHIEQGESRFEAALNGAREMAVPVVAMTTTLIAVYAPIGFMGGLVGALFTEFAFTLAGAVLVSGVVALTLSPMLSGKVLRREGETSRFESAVERNFERLADGYRGALSWVLESVGVVVLLAVLLLASIWFMLQLSRAELAPTEDQGILLFQAEAPQTATLEYLETYAEALQRRFEELPGYDETFMLLGGQAPNVLFGGFKLAPWDEREISQFEVEPMMQQAVSEVTGLRTSVFARPSIPGAGDGLPVQFVITTARDYERLDEVADEILGRAMQSGLFGFLQKSIEFDRPVQRVVVDRDRVADLGLSMADVGRELSGLLGGGYINRFSMQGRSYEVIPRVERDKRAVVEDLSRYYLRADSGQLVPLGNFVKFETVVEPSQRTQFNQLNSVALEGVLRPGVSTGQAVAFLESAAAEVFPQGFGYDYKGQTRQFKQQGSALAVTFLVSLIVIYLVLAAQFESWRDPFIILVSVPLSVAGAMAFIMLGFATMNIYTQVGLITLIGVVSKNGILIVEFANKLQVERGMDRLQAVIEGAAIRLRPILMTSVALIVAMIPLLLAGGPGAESRFAIGLTIATGLGIGTLLTLFVLPAFYVLLARDHAAERGASAGEGDASTSMP
ncbi:MAG: efflux RND transporter permease subunit [Wenzhouxiangellaceae bacterium]|nr:efflux RND transporter permease subunit [Wenzhouxiangellaceae bacterium]